MPETTQKRRNRVFKSLHKPLTYMGIERTLFFFVAVSAVGMFNLFNSIIGGIIVFIGGCIFGHWVTNSDPASGFLDVPRSSSSVMTLPNR
jgi:type IV secretory pathway TrbD component